MVIRKRRSEVIPERAKVLISAGIQHAAAGTSSVPYANSEGLNGADREQDV